MKRDYSILEFEIIDKEYITSSNKKFEKTVKIILNNNGVTEERQLAYVHFNSINWNIANNFDFSDCFIHEFSISKYKEKINSETFELIELEEFIAEKAIFYSENEAIDFSFTKIKNKEEINFSNTIFISKKLNFSHVIFDTEVVNFENSSISCKEIDFSNSDFGRGNCIFSNCYFQEGIKSFKNSNFGIKEKLFVNTFFNDGNISFDNCFFNDGKVSFKIAKFGKGRKDFNEVEFGGGEVVFERVEFGLGNINFKNTQFGKGTANFKKIDFGVGNISFRSSHFGDGDVSFMNSKFDDGKVNFAHVEFGEGKKDFHYAEFGKGDVLFERTNFGKGQVDFSTVDFNEGKVNFKRAIFDDGLVNFEASILKQGNMIFEFNMFNRGVLNFSETDYSTANIHFNDIDLGQNTINFSEGKFGEIKLTGCQLNNNINLKAQYIGKLDLSHSIIRDVVDIEPSEKDIVIKEVNFSGLRLLGTIYIDWKRLNLKELIYKQDNTFLEKADQFRMLKENFNSIGRYNDEDDAYVEFKRTEAKSNYYKSIQKNPRLKVFILLKYWFEKILFDKTGLYATSPARVIFGMLFVYVLFSLLYYVLHFFSDSALISGVGNPDNLGFLASSFYHSAVTFLTIGYGDIYPTGILRIISGIEGFVGVFFMSYFTVAFVRKILR